MDCTACGPCFGINSKDRDIPEAVVPRSECGKTLYTKRDYLLEQSVHEHVMELEQLYKKYENVLNQQLEIQRGLITDLWTQSQKHLILTRGGLLFKPYPEIVSHHTEEAVLSRFYANLGKLQRSNCLLSAAMDDILDSHSELDSVCKQLNMTVGSPFVNGSCSLISLCCIRNILNDLLCYFYGDLCKLTRWSQVSAPDDAQSLEDYMKLIESNSRNHARKF